MSQIKIRRMTELDAPAVFAIEQATAISPWSERLFSDCVAVGYECWVVTEDENIIGFGILSYAAEESHLLNIAIRPDKQQQGLGEKLLRHFIELAKTLDAQELFLEVRVSNIAARRLYEKFNFVEIGLRKDYYPTGDNGEAKEDALTLALTL